MGSGSLDERGELRRLAEAATPGPWQGCAHVAETDKDCPCRYRGDVSDGERVLLQLGVGPDHPDGRDEGSGWKSIPTPDREQGYANGRYIAAVSPDVVLGLLDRIEAAERVLDDLVEAIAELDWENAGLSDEQAAAWHHARDFLDSGPAAPSKESSDA